MALLQSDVAEVMQRVAKPGEGEILVELIEKLQEFILATGDTETINLWLDESIGGLPKSVEDIQGLDWNIDRLIAAARALAQTERQAGPPLLSDARAELLSTTGDERYKPLGNWSEIIAALPAADRAMELIALFGTHQALLEAATHAERMAIAALLVHGTADTDGDGQIEANEVAPADRLDFLNATGAYAATQGGAHDIDLRFAGSAAQALLAGEGVVAGGADGAGPAGDGGKTAPVSSGAAVADVGPPVDASPADGDASSGPAVDARLQFVRVGLDGRAIDDGGAPLVANAGPTDGLLLIGGEAADSLAGSTGNDTITGNAGNDRLAGGAGDDAVSGGNGDDVVSGGSGADQLSGDAGDDLVLGGAGADQIDGGAGDDILDAGADGATIEGGAGDDVLLLGANDLAASGGDGNDIVVASGPNSSASGGQGFDWIIYTSTHVDSDGEGRSFEGQSGSAGADHLIAGHAGAIDPGAASRAIDDLAAYLEEIGVSDAALELTGSILLGGGGSDTLQGSSGNDIIDGDLSLSVLLYVDANGNDIADEGEVVVGDLSSIEDDLLAGAIAADRVETRRSFGCSDDDRDDVDTVKFSGRRGEYDISVDGTVTTVAHRLLDATGAIVVDTLGLDGLDRLMNVERLEFADEMLVLDFAGMAWIIDGDGDMFVFASDETGDHTLTELGDRGDLMEIDMSIFGTDTDAGLVGIYDYMQADYAA